MDRRHLMAGGAAGAAALATPRLASAQPRLRWRCPGSYPKSVDTQWACHELFCKRVGELTDGAFQLQPFGPGEIVPGLQVMDAIGQRSEEHTSELQSRQYLVCRLLLEKKKNIIT